MFLSKKTEKKGFTLIELLVVIAIIGILASVVLASLNSARRKSRDARRLADIKQIQVALEMAFDGEGTYPVGAFAAMETALELTTCAGTSACMTSVPADPLATQAYEYANIGATNYVLKATLEDISNPALDSDVNGTVGGLACGSAGTAEYCVQP